MANALIRAITETVIKIIFSNGVGSRSIKKYIAGCTNHCKELTALLFLRAVN